jgi:general secretion pathway protein A
MFLKYHGLQQDPFGDTPNPDFLYFSSSHREALAALLCVELGRGFLALIAPPGMGKTTLLFKLMRHLRSSTRVVFLFHTQCTSREFMRLLLNELGWEIDATADLATIVDQFNSYVLQEYRAGRRLVIIVDEAQNLDSSVLETVRLLSDFETPHMKLLQIILAGQPELADKLASPELRQLRQRISTFCSLTPLSSEQTGRYIRHRLRVAGCSSTLFSAQAQEAVAQLSKGIPRNINNLCSNSLALCCAMRQNTITASMVREVAGDFDLTKFLSNDQETSIHPDVSGAPALANNLPHLEAMRSMTPAEALSYIRRVTTNLKTMPD